ncbi:transcriptional regulator, TetR family [Desulfatibacillum alkenivorans DSM 16219]|jgi:AcrR family transcriptional regulator|uniref:Transcriptional regulator, TetR family n=2 Tax=Desulfatibacillum alkenivorans TaxID=259354 RepID=A0A1M6FGL9_9BACT|nr:transcriptional regulator, TetR family [Desulfatibacillum alkenivorans DSM 16219]
MMTENSKMTHSKGEARGEATRQKILAAADKVFSQHPFGAASVRKIAQKGGFEHPLIQYHFKTKARLFEEYITRLNEEFISTVLSMLPGLEKVSPAEGLSLFLDRILEHGFQSSFMKVMMLNVGGMNFLDKSLPGAENMRKALQKVAGFFKEAYSPKGTGQELYMWMFAFALVLNNFLGARHFHAKTEDLNPESDEYRKWVKEAMMFLFLPPLQRVMKGTQVQDFGPIAPRGYGRKKKKPSGLHSHLRKGEATRLKILDAAREVFSTNPYSTASIRMIGKKGGFDFTLIHHYFPTKKELFEAVGVDLLERSLDVNQDIMEGLETMPALAALTEAFGRILSNSFANPAAEMVLMQNMAQMDRGEEIPGFEFVMFYHKCVMDMIQERFFPDAPPKVIQMWLHCLVTITYSCVGSPAYPARIAGMDPQSKEYRQWVKDTLVFLFFPTLYDMLFPGEAKK